MPNESRAKKSNAAPSNAESGSLFGPLGWIDATREATLLALSAQDTARAVVKRHLQDDPAELDPLHMQEPFRRVAGKLARQPGKLLRAQFDLWWKHAQLGGRQARKALGQSVEPLMVPEPGDRRFRHEAWQDSLFFNTLEQSYLLSSAWLRETLGNVDGIDEPTRKRVDFYTRQFTSAVSPTNFALTNPEVLAATVESGGRNLLAGLENLLGDIRRGKGKLKIRMTDEDAFEIGRDVATAPGKVVYQTDLMQLLQFSPSTATVREIPLLIVPPWINKYYILDLRPSNSLIRWAVAQGHTVFVISWVNPDRELAGKSFEDYVEEGTLAALRAAQEISASPRVNTMAYCLGGTLLVTTLGYLAAKGDDSVASATFMASLADFADAGDIRVYIDEQQVASIERRMRRQGYLDAPAMAFSFNSLRENDLVWNYVIHNYLLGKAPVPFDLLFWNADATRMPAAMHSFYLRNMYLENNLAKPNGLTILGEPIDLRRVRTPAFWISLVDDHIAPWGATYASTQLLSGPRRFVLGGSGHIAGIINPPTKSKYGYWTNDELPADPAAWKAGAEAHDGSWWPEWQKWIAPHAGECSIRARQPGSAAHPPVEDAPGSYVKGLAD